MSDSSSNEAPPSWGWRILRFICIVLAIAFVKLLIRGTSPSDIIACFTSSKPPIQLTMRKGNLGGDVIQLSNTSSEMLILDCLAIYEGPYSSMVSSVSLKPYETKEFGVLEFNPSWKPKDGNKGFVAIRGYSQKLYFTIQKDSYTYKFISDIPTDYPRKSLSL